MQRVFGWTIVAKQPLTLDQLHEVLAIEPCQPFSKPERLLNDINKIIAWCESLIVLDEEDHVVQFTHATVQSFLLGPIVDPDLAIFAFREPELDMKAGEICVTYLNFSDFEKSLVKGSRKTLTVEPAKILDSALTQNSSGPVRRAVKTVFQSIRLTTC